MSLSIPLALESKMSSHAESEHLLFSLPEYEEEAADFIADLGRQYQEAFMRRKTECRLTQQQVAEMLDVHRSFVNRCLSGSSNMTAETMAKLAWALGGRASFKLLLDDDLPAVRSNYFVGTAEMSNTIIPASQNRVNVHIAPSSGATRIQLWPSTTTLSTADILEVNQYENS